MGICLCYFLLRFVLLLKFTSVLLLLQIKVLEPKKGTIRCKWVLLVKVFVLDWIHAQACIYEYVPEFVCVLMSTCACFCVNLWAQQPDWADAWVPSEQEEEGRRGAMKRYRCSPNHHYPCYPVWVCRWGQQSGWGPQWAARRWASGSDTCSPLATPSSLQLLRSAPSASTSSSLPSLLLPLPPPPQQTAWRRSSSQQAVEQHVGPVHMFLHVWKEEGFVRTQTPTQTITVTSADCLGATEAAVKWDDWYKMVCVAEDTPGHTLSSKTGEHRAGMCFMYNCAICLGTGIYSHVEHYIF